MTAGTILYVSPNPSCPHRVAAGRIRDLLLVEMQPAELAGPGQG